MENPKKYNNGVCPNKVIIDLFYIDWIHELAYNAIHH